MPKIIKNGTEYSGVPVEVVTAWAPTADPVQVKEPLMGNTDISSIGDGTVTGAIEAVNTGLTSFQIRKVNFSYNITANGNAHGNLYSIINNDMPSGYRFLAFAGFNTASVNVFMSNMRYVNSDYSIELRNVSTSAVAQTSDIFYLCAKI